MSLLEVVEEVAFLEAIRKNRGPNQRNGYGPLKMLGALLCFEAISEAFGNVGMGLGAMALGATAMNGGLLGGGEAAGSASAAAAAAPIAKAAPKATPQPSLGLSLSPAAPGMSM